MAYQLGSLLNRAFKNAHPTVQLVQIICMTVLSIIALYLGYSDLAWVAVFAFAPTPLVSLLNVAGFMANYDLVAVASKAANQGVSVGSVPTTNDPASDDDFETD